MVFFFLTVFFVDIDSVVCQLFILKIKNVAIQNTLHLLCSVIFMSTSNIKIGVKIVWHV